MLIPLELKEQQENVRVITEGPGVEMGSLGGEAGRCLPRYLGGSVNL